MPEWLTSTSTEQLPADFSILTTRLLSAWVFGCVIAWLARRNKPDSTADTLSLTLILMSVLIAMATQIIGDNVARAFSLVGALSIVRFRTAVPETRDVAFVLAAVVVGMAIGAGQYWVASIGTVVVAMATHINGSQRQQKSEESEAAPSDTWKLTIQTGLSAPDGWESELKRFTNEIRLSSVETTRRGSAMQTVYRVVLKPEVSLPEIVSALNSMPTVESVTARAS